MAGGTWTSQSKKQPGVYINVKSSMEQSVKVGDRGIVAICEPLSWGPEGELMTINAGEDFTSYIGYSATSEKSLFLREIFKGSERTSGPAKVMLHHTVSSPHLFGRRHHDAIPLPIERLHGIALHFERIDAPFAGRGQVDLVPALSSRKPGTVKKPAGARLGEAQQWHGAVGQVACLQERPHAGEEGVEVLSGGIEDFGNALGGWPALAAILVDALGDVERGGIEPGELGQGRHRKTVTTGKRVNSVPEGPM